MKKKRKGIILAGGHGEKNNLEVLKVICNSLDELKPKDKSYLELITYVRDRAGHDKRYAINASKIRKELGWQPKVSFEDGIKKTINWYFNNQTWWR